MIEKKKTVENAVITRRNVLSDGMIDLWIETKEIAKTAQAGQFVSVYCKDGSRLLPRPISICECDPVTGNLRLVFRVVGEGTRELESYAIGEMVKVMGPLGNGFEKQSKDAILIGGGVGIPPMLQLAKELKQQNPQRKLVTVLGYRDNDNFLCDEFKTYGDVFIATEDGSVGTKGNVMDVIQTKEIHTDAIYACGPKPMLKAIQDYAIQNNICAQISMEERMACGIGACLACVCKTKEIDEHSHVKNKRVCKDGPVFYVDDIEI